MSQIKSIQEQELEEQKLRDIVLLLSQLFQREEATAKEIVGCLYDIAKINLINKYIPLWGINQTLKYLLRFPRPIAKSLGVKFYVQNVCPQLITDWFETLVEFPANSEADDDRIVEAQVVKENLLPVLKENKLKIESLQGKVRLLQGTLVTTIVIFSSSVLWVSHNLNINPLDLMTTTQATIQE